MGRSGQHDRGQFVTQSRTRYSCIGACCSISRHALILSRRHTQQSGSLEARTMVSAPQTEHLHAFLRRSGEMDCFACSSISAGITGSDFSCGLRFITTQSDYTMTESAHSYNTTGSRLLLVPVPRQPLPETIHNADTWSPWTRVVLFPSDRYPRVRCACKSGSEPSLVYGVPACSSFQPSLYWSDATPGHLV